MPNQPALLDLTFQALADPTRRAMVERLSRGPASVSELARPLAMSLPAVMQHLTVLEGSGLVRSQKVGRVRTCRIEPAALSNAEAWINQQRSEWERPWTGWASISTHSRTKETIMTQTAEREAATPTAPLRLSRRFAAPRATVFAAWSSTDHVQRWFCPDGFTVPACDVQMHAGGPFEVCMRGPDGVEHWIRGTFVEIVPAERLVLDLYVADAQGNRLFRAFTEVSFADEFGGTRMEVVQTYTLADPAAAWMTAGAPAGWAQTLDKLERELARMRAGEVQRSVAHGTFHLERTYDAPVQRVYEALSIEAAKSRWFGGAEGRWQALERQMDFRVGGRERLKGKWEGGAVSTFEAVYQDIVPCERIIYTYEMHMDDRKISVSLATLQLKSLDSHKTTLMVTEQGAYLDGFDDGSRERGTAHLLDRLGESLGRPPHG